MYTPETEFNPDKYERIPSVAVFKEHERIKSGRAVKVTRKDLQQIADNHNRKFRELGVGVPLSYGHTLDSGPDGAEVPEKDQPELVGWCVNFSVGKLPSGEDTLFGDFYLPKDKAEWVIENLPTRSVEYYPNSQRIHPIALLKTSAPELDLPVIRYSGEEAPHLYFLTDPIHYSEKQMPSLSNPFSGKPNMEDEIDTEKRKSDERKEADLKNARKAAEGDLNKKKYEEDDKPMDAAKEKVTQGATQDKADVAELKEQVQQLMAMMSKFAPLMEELEGLMAEEGGAEGDLMQPAGQPKGSEPEEEEEEDEEDGKKPPMAKEKDEAKKVEGDPIKFGGMPSSTNVAIPSYEKDKFSMNDEAVKYKKEVDSLRAEVAKYKKEQAAKDAILNELAKDKKAMQAKEYVRRLEEEELVAYASEEIKQADIKFFELLDKTEADNYFEMAKVRYAKKSPSDPTVVARYQATQEPDLHLSPTELARIADEAVNKGLNWKDALKQAKKK